MPEKVILRQKNPAILDIVQITDCHIFTTDEGRFDGVDTAASLSRVVDRINTGKLPDMVLVTGDLVNDGEAPAYQRLLALLKRLHTPVYCLPGNHDIPALMHGLINEANVATDKVLDGRNWRVVLLDTVLANNHAGHLSREELGFLDETLRAAGDQFILLAMHHHPVSVNSPWMDTMNLENPDEFFAVIDRYPAVKAVIWGHIHQDFSSQRNKVPLLGTPSTCRQFRLETEISAVDDKPPAYRRISLHRDGHLSSEVCWIME